MGMRKGLIAIAVAALVAWGQGAQAKTFKWAFQGDIQSLDPHSLFETFSLGFWSNIYEPLVGYDADLALTPMLAVEWKTIEPTKWRIKLRRGVKFHNGNDFTADDVIFSWQRALSE
ncbi:MAG: ABC transporter substrate-binding protein, partial [Alphaproteobacteria bacterium]